MDDMPTQFNEETGRWEPCKPLPFHYGLIPFLWKRLTGWQDEYGRQAFLYKFWE